MQPNLGTFPLRDVGRHFPHSEATPPLEAPFLQSLSGSLNLRQKKQNPGVSPRHGVTYKSSHATSSMNWESALLISKSIFLPSSGWAEP